MEKFLKQIEWLKGDNTINHLEIMIDIGILSGTILSLVYLWGVLK